MSNEPNPRRFAIWAASLVLPLVLGAVALPHVQRWARSGTGDARSAAAAASAASAASARGADAALGDAGGTPGRAAPPPRRDGPTTEQIEAARAAEEELARARRGWQKVEVMAPRQATVGADGEQVAPFQGFGLSLDSKPAGARVTLNGRDVGETPLLTSVACTPGEPVEVRLERRGHRPQVRTVRCRADTLLTLSVDLSR